MIFYEFLDAIASLASYHYCMSTFVEMIKTISKASINIKTLSKTSTKIMKIKRIKL